MAVIEDIRVYRCKVMNVTGVWPEAFYNPKLSAVVRRINTKKVVIKPRKIGQSYLQPIEFALK